MTAPLFRPGEIEGGFVYPRLPHSAARELIHERRDWSADQLRRASALTHPAAAPARAGTVVPEQRLSAVRDGVRSALAEAKPKFASPVPRPRVADFDRTVGAALYETMQILPADAASEGVWSFVTLVLLPEIGPWRFPGAGEKRYLGVSRNVLRRTWWRAHVLGPDLGGRTDASPYLGEDELVQIFERPSLAANPWVSRAIVSAVHQSAAEVTVARSEFVRDLTRRLLRLTPLLSLDALPEKELGALLGQLVTESRIALQGAN